MLTFANKYKGGQYSQNGEAGIIDECIKRIGFIGGVAIEFGAPTKQYCSNIYHLYENPQWTCLFLDDNPQEEGINKVTITPDNINKLPPCTILSMDTDGEDYRLWQAYKRKPDIVIIEINSSLEPMREHFNSTNGASYITMLKLGIEKGYFLLCHTGNMIFLLDKYRELFPEIEGTGVLNWEYYFNKSWINADI